MTMVGRCCLCGDGAPVVINRMIEVTSEITSAVTGLEDTSWTHAERGYIGAHKLSKSNSDPDTEWHMNGLRYQASAGPYFPNVEVYQHAVKGEGGFYGYAALYGDPPYQTGQLRSGVHVSARNRGFVFTSAMSASSHVQVRDVDEFIVPLQFTFGPQPLGPLSYDYTSHKVDVLQARPTINGVVVGPMTTINHRMLMVDPDEQPHSSYHNGGLNCYVKRVALPLDSGTQVTAGDVIGFDVWVKVTKLVTSIRDTVVYAPRGIFNFQSYAEAVAGFGSSARREWVDSQQMTYTAGVTDGAFKPGRHTYQLDFGGATQWTPITGQPVWTMEGGSGWSVTINDGTISGTNISLMDGPHAPGSPSGNIVLSWDGERAVLTFREIVPKKIPGVTTVENFLEINYEPEPSGLYPDINIGLGHPQSGLFKTLGTTTFKLKSAWWDSVGGLNPQFGSAIASRHGLITGVAGANISNTIIVTKVDQ